MSQLFRSETMRYVRLTIANDAAHDTLNELGKLGQFQLIDMHGEDAVVSDTFMYFKKRVVTCSAWEKKLAQFEKDMQAHNVEVPGFGGVVTEYRGSDVLTDVQAFIEPIEDDLNRYNEYNKAETRYLNELVEKKIVLETLKDQIQRQEVLMDDHVVEMQSRTSDIKQPFLAEESSSVNDMKDEEKNEMRLHSFLTGIVPMTQQPTLERMVFRISRGNAYVRFFPIADEVNDPLTGESVRKSVFYIVYIGDVMTRRLAKVCEHLRATIYPVPSDSKQHDATVAETKQQIDDKKSVLHATRQRIVSSLRSIAWDPLRPSVSPLRDWQDALRRERLICDGLRKCQIGEQSKLVIAEGWIPADAEGLLQSAVRQAVRFSGAQPAIVMFPDTKAMPPTYFRTSKVTSVFQGIVNTYGVPRYKEVNPGIFTIVTFPFLFGIMYGDIGHGLFLFLWSSYIVFKEKEWERKKREKTLGELPSMIFGGRYMLVAMGFFAVYAGTIYNDCLSLPINVFGSKWRDPRESEVPNIVPFNVTMVWNGEVYPYGLDPYWYNTKNELTFFNSLKMKLSVTIGVTQMTFGIVLGLFNHTYNHDRVSVFMEWIPQMLFMLSTFGYMIFLIIYKYTVDWQNTKAAPPNLIQTMIKMFLSMGAVDGDPLYPGQETVQQALLATAIVSLPWMLLGKPHTLKFFHNRNMRRRQQNGAVLLATDEAKHSEHEQKGGGGGGHDDHAADPDKPFPLSDFMIHQSIHTIEFVLGAVSNTASYLRLWALSLAHAELAAVFWDKLIMEYGATTGNPLMAFVGWAAWAAATFAVLCCMDVLECFLHALRLHWVEFQNKFFHADGHPFTPFTFEEQEED